MQQAIPNTTPVLSDWVVKRSGPGLTVTGTNLDGTEVKLSGIKAVGPSKVSKAIIAFDMTGKVAAELLPA